MPGHLTLPDVPTGVPPTFQEHLKLLMDLQMIALQADITRVSTLMFARELSGAVFPETSYPRSVPQPVAPLERPATWIGSRS